jgi:hypothetical protein
MPTKPSTQVVNRGPGQTVTQKLTSVAPKRILIQEQDLKSPVTMQRLVNDLYQTIEQETRALRALPFASGVWLKNQSFVASTTLYLQHGLQRPYLGWFCTRSTNGAFVGKEMPLLAAQTSDRVLPLQSANTCTADIFVF